METRRGVGKSAVGLFVVALMGLTACTSGAPSSEVSLPGVSVELPKPADPIPLAKLGEFTGVARLEMGSNCTGTLIDTGVEDGPAYLITNGHCVGDVGRAPQQVTVAEPWFGQGYFLDTYDNPTPVTVNAEALEYSTMRGRDVAIIRLKEDLGYLKELGINPVAIIDAEPTAGVAVKNVAAPVQNLDQDDWVLRGGDCKLLNQTDLLEFHWLWADSWANDCPGVKQGSSGSPLFTLKSDGGPEAIAAVINTTTWGASLKNGGLCAMNRPCEFGDEITMIEETSYASSVAGIGKCFDSDGVFKLGGECPLEISSVWAHNSGGIFRGGELPDAMKRLPEANLTINPALGDSAAVRTVLVPLTSAQVCTDPAIYSGAAEISVPAVEYSWDPGYLLSVSLPEEEGHYALCAVARDDYAGAAAVVFEVDRTPPIFNAGASIEDLGGGAISVVPFLNPPELANIRYTWLPGDAQCPDPSTFNGFRIVPLTLMADELPATYCIYAMDQAGNPTDVVRIPLPRR